MAARKRAAAPRSRTASRDGGARASRASSRRPGSADISTRCGGSGSCAAARARSSPERPGRPRSVRTTAGRSRGQLLERGLGRLEAEHLVTRPQREQPRDEPPRARVVLHHEHPHSAPSRGGDPSLRRLRDAISGGGRPPRRSSGPKDFLRFSKGGAAAMPDAGSYEFGPFRMDAGKQVLWRSGQIVPLTPKSLALLHALLERNGDVVLKRELLSRVWPDAVVEEANLSVTVAALRKALGAREDGGSYIQTISRRGYRFAAPLRAGGTPPRLALAVLPFACLGPETEPDFGIGLADALIGRLTEAEELRVRPTAAVARYADSPRPPRDAAAGARGRRGRHRHGPARGRPGPRLGPAGAAAGRPAAVGRLLRRRLDLALRRPGRDHGARGSRAAPAPLGRAGPEPRAQALARGVRELPARPLLLGALRPRGRREGVRLLRRGDRERPGLRGPARRALRRPPAARPRRPRAAAPGLGPRGRVRGARARARPLAGRGARLVGVRAPVPRLGLERRARGAVPGARVRAARRLGPPVAGPLPRPRGRARRGAPGARRSGPSSTRSRASRPRSAACSTWSRASTSRRSRSRVGPSSCGRSASSATGAWASRTSTSTARSGPRRRSATRWRSRPRAP